MRGGRREREVVGFCGVQLGSTQEYAMEERAAPCVCGDAGDNLRRLFDIAEMTRRCPGGP